MRMLQTALKDQVLSGVGQPVVAVVLRGEAKVPGHVSARLLHKRHTNAFENVQET